MVDITRCVRCGRAIPALDNGCAHCDAEQPERADAPYLPLAMKLLLGMFTVVAALTAFLAILTMRRNVGPELQDSLLVVLATFRFLLSALATFAVVARPEWGRVPCLGFVFLEIASAAAMQFGWLPESRWAGGILAPLWSVVFVFVFFREDVAAYFDPRVEDRKAVGDLLRSIQGGKRR